MNSLQNKMIVNQCFMRLTACYAFFVSNIIYVLLKGLSTRSYHCNTRLASVRT